MVSAIKKPNGDYIVRTDINMYEVEARSPIEAIEIVKGIKNKQLKQSK